jgi:hypothetical protein
MNDSAPDSNDVKGFLGALAQSFALAQSEGRVEATWTPRSYAEALDLSGGITGAQASLYTRARVALNQSLPLLDDLHSLNPDADAEDAAAIRAVLKDRFTELVDELGMIGGPRIARVNHYFGLLLVKFSDAAGPDDPDRIAGILGKLRDLLWLNSAHRDAVSSIDDEQNVTNFRIVADYLTSLAQSWLDYVGFFGSMVVQVSRQLSVVAESGSQVRFTLDSVFVGPAERQTMSLLLNCIRDFASKEGPALLQEGGLAAFDRFAQAANRLADRVHLALCGSNAPQVRQTIERLDHALGELADLARSLN